MNSQNKISLKQTKNNLFNNVKNNQAIEYFIVDPTREVNMAESTETLYEIFKSFDEGIGHFKITF